MAAGVLAAKQPERSWQVWTRARLGGERRIDIARASGYKDGNAITQILKRLRQEAQSKAAVAGQMSPLETELNNILPSFKSGPHSPTKI